MIHGNIPHTGLVGVGTHGSKIEDNSVKRLGLYHSEEMVGVLSEEEAIISIPELEAKRTNSHF